MSSPAGNGDHAAEQSGTPASHFAHGSVPVERAGMASGTADLQRDPGGAILSRSSARAAKESFLKGDQWAYLAGIAAIVIGATLVFFLFPRRAREEELLAEYRAEDAAPAEPARAPS